METFWEIWQYELLEITDTEKLRVGQVVLGLLILILGMLLSSLLSRMVGRRMRRRDLNPTAAAVAQKVVYYVLLVAVLFTTLFMLKIPITAFAFLGGAIAIGVGFGTQQIMNNFISGWILIAERPVRIGDLVEIGDSRGTVEFIGARCTRVRRTDGVDLLVPNSQLLEQTVINWTLTDNMVRTTVRVGVVYGSDVRKTEELLYRAAKEEEGVLKQPPPLVVFEDFGDNALVFDLYIWAQVNRPMELRKIRSDLRFKIDALFREAGLVIAFPQRDVHLDTLKPLDVRMVGGAAAKAGD